MSEPRRLSGRVVIAVFAAALAAFAAILYVGFWNGPKGKFTEAERAKQLPVPAVIRTTCIDPANNGPKSLDEWPHCSNADRLEFTMNPVAGPTLHAMWALVGPRVAGVTVHGPLNDPWADKITLKGLPPGQYALIYVLSTQALDQGNMQALFDQRLSQLDQLKALEGWVKHREGMHTPAYLQRLTFTLDAARG